jgi:hypothetical protein
LATPLDQMTDKGHIFYRYMKQKNRYVARAKISEKRFRTFLRWFAAGVSARIIARRTNLNRNTVNRLARLLRSRIAEECAEGGTAAIRLRAGDAFWHYARARFSGIRRVHAHTAFLHLKECEWRYAHRGKNAYPALLAMLRKRPLTYS